MPPKYHWGSRSAKWNTQALRERFGRNVLHNPRHVAAVWLLWEAAPSTVRDVALYGRWVPKCMALATGFRV